MDILRLDLQNPGAEFKILNATNGGLDYQRHKKDQLKSNFADYKAVRIPYSRNHDSAAFQMCSELYGTTNRLGFSMQNYSALLIKEK